MCRVHVQLARALSTSSSNAMYHRITHIELHQCTKFGAASSKFPRTRGPLSNKVFRFCRAQPGPHKNSNQKSTQIGVVYVWPASLGPVVPFIWPVGSEKGQKMQNTCTRTARAAWQVYLPANHHHHHHLFLCSSTSSGFSEQVSRYIQI